jgi:hypothetical protein
MAVSTCPMEIALRRQLPALLALLLANGMALADIRIGVIASSTGPTAVVGIPQKQGEQGGKLAAQGDLHRTGRNSHYKKTGFPVAGGFT